MKLDKQELTQMTSKSIQLGSFNISEESSVFIIAEIGINHNGSLELAKQLVDQAIWAGADCVKFQMRNLKELYHNAGNPNDSSEDLGSQYILDLLSFSQLSRKEMFEIFNYCHVQGILPLCSPWDLASVSALEDYGIEGYKIASADLTNHPLLEAVIKTGKPIILSTGMSTESEIRETVAHLKVTRSPYVLLHCISSYPAAFKNINLQYLSRLKEIGDCPVGYSGHERGYYVALAAVAKGAKIIEKHFTLDKNMQGNDHKISLLPQEFKAMVKGIRQIEAALGTGEQRFMSQGERMNRENLAKSIVVNRDLQIGETISAEMLDIKSPGKGLQPNLVPQLIGRRVKRTMKAGDFFFASDLQDSHRQSRNYAFKRRWGLPVRYHDYNFFKSQSNMDLLEFHLSYKDLELDPRNFFRETHNLDLVVHSPDLFSGDHLLNLAAEDESYRQHSIRELQRVIDLTRHLTPYFVRSTRPLIVLSPGGFSSEKPLPAEDRPLLYERVAQSLSQLDIDGVEIIPQTLPPFPWYRGGQLFCNLFVDAADTAKFCQDYGYRLCLDIAHSKLAAKQNQEPFSEVVEQLAPLAAHLHIVDAKGIDGEGLQIDEGEVNFTELIEQLEKLTPESSFIPEIWQGHKNRGEGFWIALDRLEKYFRA